MQDQDEVTFLYECSQDSKKFVFTMASYTPIDLTELVFKILFVILISLMLAP